MDKTSLTEAADALRHFNRFYTAQIGVLDRDLLGSGWSLSEARVLYELANHEVLTAGDLTTTLAIDAGYLSRMLTRFEREGLIERRRSDADGRVAYLVMTDKGRKAFAELDRLSQTAAETTLTPLPECRRGELVDALRRVETVLAREHAAGGVTLRGHRPGDMGWIVHRQAALYAHEYGWDESYEALICEVAASFLRNFDPGRERCWIAERGGEIVGSVFCVRESDQAAKLRLLYVEPSERGAGLGSRLLGECIAFASEKGYARLNLWTNSVLTAARRIYERAGFALIREEPHHSFGHDLVGQYWSLDLSS